MPRPPSDWLPRARKLRKELRDAHFGDKREIFEKHAESTGYTVETLKKEVTAADFVARMEGEFAEFAGHLKALGVAAVVELARLYRDDKQSAIERAREVAEGQRPWTDIRRFRKTSQFAESNNKRRALLETLVEYVESQRGTFRVRESVPTSAPGASLAYRLDRGGELCVALQLVGNMASYDKLAACLALLAFYDVVIVGIDQFKVPHEWLHFLQKVRISTWRFQILGIEEWRIERLPWHASKFSL